MKDRIASQRIAPAAKLESAVAGSRAPRLLRVHHVAARLGVAPRTVRYRATGGLLPAHKRGKWLWFFCDTDVLAYLDACRGLTMPRLLAPLPCSTGVQRLGRVFAARRRKAAVIEQRHAFYEVLPYYIVPEDRPHSGGYHATDPRWR